MIGKSLPSHGILFLFCALFLAGVSGCLSLGGKGESPQVHYYSLPVNDAAIANGVAPNSGYAVGLDRIEIPRYLDKNAFVIRSGPAELRYTTDHLWAEPLRAGISRLMSNHVLAHSESVAQVQSVPWRDDFNPRWVVRLRVQSFEAEESPDASVLLHLRWEVLDTATSGRVKSGEYSLVKDWVWGDFYHLVELLGNGLEEAASKIAEDISQLD